MSTKRFIALDKAIRSNLLKEGDRLNISSIFQEKSICLNSSFTGHKIDQVFFVEDIPFFYAKNIDGMPVLWGDTTKKKLLLSGENGAKNGHKTVDFICSYLYSYLRLGFRAYSTKAEDIRYLIKNPKMEQIISEMEPAWLNSQDDYINADYIDFGINFVNGKDIYGISLFCSYGAVKYYSCGVRPAILVYNIPQSIYIDCENEKNQWKLISKKEMLEQEG